MRAELLPSCPTLCDPMDCSPPGSSVHSPGKNTGVGCHALLQGIFPTRDQIWVSSVSCFGRRVLYPEYTGSFQNIFISPPEHSLWFVIAPSKWASAYNAGDPSLIPGSGRSHGEGNGNPAPVFLPGEFHGQRNMSGYSPRGRRELDMTEGVTHT